MADKDVKPAAKKPHPALFLVVIVALLVALGVGLFVSKPKTETGGTTQATEETAAATETTAPGEQEAAPAKPVKIDVNAALSDRALGDTSAPVKISEHASLTCGHCGAFHRETFDQIKKEYIDTKKVYLVFSDFPLNEPALDASMVARCLPEDKYFDFIHMLFQEQEKWAYDPNYKEFLKAEAGKNGLDEAHFNACLDNKELKDGIINRMKGIQQQWNINSTPSFVINNRTTVSGAYPFDEFKKIIETELSGQKSDAPAATDQSESATSPAVTTEEPKAEEPAAEETPAPDEAPAAETDTSEKAETPVTKTEEAPAPAEEAPAATESKGSGEKKAE